MPQLVTSMSGLVLGGVVMVVGSSLIEAKYLQHLSAQLIHYISLYLFTVLETDTRKRGYR